MSDTEYENEPESTDIEDEIEDDLEDEDEENNLTEADFKFDPLPPVTLSHEFLRDFARKAYESDEYDVDTLHGRYFHAWEDAGRGFGKFGKYAELCIERSIMGCGQADSLLSENSYDPGQWRDYEDSALSQVEAIIEEHPEWGPFPDSPVDRGALALAITYYDNVDEDIPEISSELPEGL